MSYIEIKKVGRPKGSTKENAKVETLSARLFKGTKLKIIKKYGSIQKFIDLCIEEKLGEK